MKALIGGSIVAALSLVCSPAFAAVMITNEGSTAFRNNLAGTVGLQFTVAGDVDLTVSALGMIDRNSNGLAETHRIGLWGASSTAIAEVTVPSGGGTLIDGFRYINLSTPITLTAGQTYTIGAQVFNTGAAGDEWRDSGTSATFGSEIGSPAARWTNVGTGGYSKPTNSGGSTGYIAPNMLYTLVPEPSSLALLGIAGAGLIRRRRQNG